MGNAKLQPHHVNQRGSSAAEWIDQDRAAGQILNASFAQISSDSAVMIADTEIEADRLIGIVPD